MSSQSEIVAAVQSAIQNHAPEIQSAVGVESIQILSEGIKNDDQWWYVPVLARPEPKRSYPYYDFLTEMEMELETRGLRVLFVPTREDEIPNPPTH